MLGQGEPSAADLGAIQKVLEEEEAHPALLIMARGERAMHQAVLERIENGEISLEEVVGQAKTSWWDRLTAFYVRDKFREHHPLLLDFDAQMIEIARLPPHERALPLKNFLTRVQEEKKKPALFLLPALAKLENACRRPQTRMRCLCAALAAERYRQAQGKWPDSLDRLVPLFLSAVPLDTFDGTPLRYRRLADGIVIFSAVSFYSVDSAGEDNQGELNLGQSAQPGTDFSIRLWDVKHRRQPPRPREKIPEPPDVPD